MDDDQDEDETIWQCGVCDAHCHPTDIMASIKDVARMRARVLTIMASRSQDQELVVEAANTYPIQYRPDFNNPQSRHIVPSFGWHPWFSHQLFDDLGSQHIPNQSEHYQAVLTPFVDDHGFLKSLPEPQPLSKFLQATQDRLQRYPYALIGEIGLDRAFRLPVGEFMSIGDIEAKTGNSKEEFTPGSREGRPLSPYRVSLEHQKLILRAQFQLAAQMQRPVSVHSVQTHGAIFDLLQDMWRGYERPSKRQRRRGQSVPKAHAAENGLGTGGERINRSLPFPSRICMHSYSGPPDALKQFLAPTVPADIYFSFSMVINFSTQQAAKVTSVIKAVPDNRILIESDLHCAGERMDGLLTDIVKKVCEIKKWNLKEGAEQLRENWERFVFGR